MILQFEQLLTEIKNILANDETIAKLILNSKPTALTDTMNFVLPQAVEDYITTTPLISLPELSAVSGGTVATFISTHITQLVFGKGGDTAAILTMSCVCSKDIYQLADGHTRIYQILERVVTLLNNVKLTPAQELRIDNLQEIYYNNNVVGYDLIFSVMGEQQANVQF